MTDQKLTRSKILSYCYEADKSGLLIRTDVGDRVTAKTFIVADGSEICVRYDDRNKPESVSVSRDGVFLGHEELAR